MDIKIAKHELLRGLKLAVGIARKGNVTPILSHAFLRVSAKKALTLAATDLNVSVSAELACAASGTGGIALGAKALYDTINSAPGDEITLKTSDDHWCEIRSGKAKWRLAGMSDRDFPKIAVPNAADAMTADAAELRKLIDRTEFATSEDDVSRPFLCGVSFESDGTTCTVSSSDGHMLVRARCTSPMPRSTGAIIPSGSALEIRKLIDKAATCSVVLSPPDLFVTVDGITVGSKLIDLKFPNLTNVIDSVAKSKVTVVVNRDSMLESLRRISPMTTELNGMKMRIGDSTVAMSAKIESGEASDEVGAETVGEITIGFHPKYLIEILDHMESDQIKMAFGTPLDPATVAPLGDDTHTCICMPMRLPEGT